MWRLQDRTATDDSGSLFLGVSLDPLPLEAPCSLSLFILVSKPPIQPLHRHHIACLECRDSDRLLDRRRHRQRADDRRDQSWKCQRVRRHCHRHPS